MQAWNLPKLQAKNVVPGHRHVNNKYYVLFANKKHVFFIYIGEY